MRQTGGTNRNKFIILLSAAYLYLGLPFVIFALGFCRIYISIPLTIIVIAGVVLCIREHLRDRYKDYPMFWHWYDILKLVLVFALILAWVGFSGVGQYSWQNVDHIYRNTIFESMVNRDWPVVFPSMLESGGTDRGLVYYIAFWMPAAIVGKLFGISAGYAMQYIWTVLGIAIVYLFLCFWRKKIMIWPIVVLILFSGMDAIGSLFAGDSLPEVLTSEKHIEWWSETFQYSANTTQLFWVFNQSVPTWVATVLMLLFEKPRNMLGVVSFVLLAAVFPFIGLVPFALFFMVGRAKSFRKKRGFAGVWEHAVRNWFSFQNLAMGGVVCLISLFYFMDNGIFREGLGFLANTGLVGSLLIVLFGAAMVVGVFLLLAYFSVNRLLDRLGYGLLIATLAIFAIASFGLMASPEAEWYSGIFSWGNLILFLILEAGVMLWCLYKSGERRLTLLSGAVLMLCPLVTFGSSNDFCMRTSIPALFVLCILCIQALDRRRSRLFVGILIGLLTVGAITPLHEIKRTYVNSAEEYEIVAIEEFYIYGREGEGYTNFSGPMESAFWQYFAK